jgi:hypothetical protein
MEGRLPLEQVQMEPGREPQWMLLKWQLEDHLLMGSLAEVGLREHPSVNIIKLFSLLLNH